MGLDQNGLSEKQKATNVDLTQGTTFEEGLNQIKYILLF